MTNTTRASAYNSGPRTGLDALNTLIKESAIAVYNKKKLFGQAGMCKLETLSPGNTYFQFSITDEPALTTTTAAITEGVTPTADAQNYESVVVETSQYGQDKVLTDRMIRQSPINIYTDTAVTIGEGLARVRDFAIQEGINDGTNVLYGDDAVSRVTVAAGDVLTSTNIANVAARLSANGAEMLTIGGKEAYALIVHPDVAFDLKTASTVTSPSRAGLSVSGDAAGAEALRMGYIGYIFGVHVFESNNLQIFEGAGAAGIDVYPCYFFGKDAYGVVEEGGIDMKMTPVGTPSDSDPLGQRSHVAGKFTIGADILKQNSMYRYEVASAI